MVSVGDDATPALPEQSSTTLIAPEQTPIAIPVYAGQDTVEIPIAFAAPPETGGIAYRVLRSDGPGEDGGRLGRLTSQENRIAVRTGSAGDADSPETVTVRVVTAGGEVVVLLVPERPVAGHYGGTVEVTSLAGMESPLSFDILVEPEDASLETATAAYIRLYNANGNLIHPGGPPGSSATRPLEWSDVVEGWVALFEQEIDPGTPRFLTIGASQPVRRGLRIEVEPLVDGRLAGTIVDRFSGYYPIVDPSGDYVYESSGMSAEFEVVRLTDVDEEFGGETPIAPVELGEVVAPGIDACESVTFPPECTTGTDIDTLEPTARLACALAVASSALESSHLRDDLMSFIPLPGEDLPDDGSFANFIDGCVETDDCAPSAELRCARQVVGRTFYLLEGEREGETELLSSLETLTREAILGPQLQAFGQDMDIRLQWLEATTGFPPFLANEMQSHVAGLLEFWERKVLDVHLDVLRTFFDSSTLLALSVPPSSDTASQRVSLLVQATQSWRGTADAVRQAATRWHTALDDPGARANKAAELRGVVAELYLAANVLRSLNLAADVEFLNSRLTGLAATTEAIAALDMSYQEWVFSRDAEVVVSTSLDPSDSSHTVLGNLRSSAERSLQQASSSIEEVLAEERQRALNEAQLEQRMETEIFSVQQEIESLCGLPAGCTRSEIGSPSCDGIVEYGRCGMNGARDSNGVLYDGELDSSEGGRAILATMDAAAGLAIAQAEMEAQDAIIERHRIDVLNYASRVEWWNRMRLEGLAATDEMINALMGLQHQAIASMSDSLDEQDWLRRSFWSERNDLRSQVEAEMVASGQLAEATFQQNEQTRAEIARDMERNIERWNELRLDDADMTLDDLLAENDVMMFIRTLQEAELASSEAVHALVAGLPRSATDISSPARGTLLQVLAVAQAGARGLRWYQENRLDDMRAHRQYDQSLRQAELQHLSEEASYQELLNRNEIERRREELALADRAMNLDITRLRNDMEMLREEEAILLAREQGVEQLDQMMLNQAMANVRDAAQREAQERQAREAYERDLQSLRDRRTELLDLIQHSSAIGLRVERAQLNALQRAAEYQAIVNRAERLMDQLELLRSQQSEILGLVGSPEAVFARASALESAERQLERAKSALMEWLVALEYYAVRPFMDQRVSILLATTPNQLEDLMISMDELYRECGGVMSAEHRQVSLRNQLLRIRQSVTDPVTGELLEPSARFRQVLGEGFISFDKWHRFEREGEMLGVLSTDQDAYLTTTFDIALGEFTNLPLVCNARIRSIGIQLEGDLGGDRALASILYDGTGILRSCQTDIEDVVELVGTEHTAFGSVTTVRTAGRMISPSARINEAPDVSNRSLEGLPLASQYTLIINTELGENADLDWSRLEDVIIHLDYEYQDPFPRETRCR